jgi:hypothetical protein
MGQRNQVISYQSAEDRKLFAYYLKIPTSTLLSLPVFTFPMTCSRTLSTTLCDMPTRTVADLAVIISPMRWFMSELLLEVC